MKSKAGLLLLSVASLMFAGHALAATDSSSPSATSILPVLVTLDDNGQVAAVDTVDRMSPAMTAELHEQIGRLIQQPGFDTAVAVPGRQFMATLAPNVQHLADGHYTVQFNLVSSQPLANGRWTWQMNANQTLSLARGHVVNRGEGNRVGNIMRTENRPTEFEPMLAPLGPTGTYLSP